MARKGSVPALVDRVTNAEVHRLREEFPEEEFCHEDVRWRLASLGIDELNRLVQQSTLKRGRTKRSTIIWPEETRLLRDIDRRIAGGQSETSACANAARQLKREGWRPLRVWGERPRLEKCTPQAVRSFYRRLKGKKAKTR
jgi:hypothetical protein